MIRKCDNNNYQIQFGRRKTVLHVNSLRRYETDADEVDGAQGQLATVVVHEQPIAGEHLLPAVTPTDHCDNTACEVSIGGQLSPEQEHALQELIDEYRDVFSTKLGETHLIEHSIRVTDETPCYKLPTKFQKLSENKFMMN